MLCHAVLLRSVVHSVLSLNAVLVAEHVEPLADVLAALIITQRKYLVTGLHLSMSLELFERSKSFRLGLHECDN